jgi:hypothetical protein
MVIRMKQINSMKSSEMRIPILVRGNLKVQFSEIDDQKKLEDSGDGILSHRPGWVTLVLGLAFAIGFLGISAFQRSYGIMSGGLRWIMMLLLFPAEWGGVLLILALFGDFRGALERRQFRKA